MVVVNHWWKDESKLWEANNLYGLGSLADRRGCYVDHHHLGSTTSLVLPTASICHVHTLITHAQPQMVIVKVCRFPAVCPTVFEQGLRLVRVTGIKIPSVRVISILD